MINPLYHESRAYIENLFATVWAGWSGDRSNLSLREHDVACLALRRLGGPRKHIVFFCIVEDLFSFFYFHAVFVDHGSLCVPGLAHYYWDWLGIASHTFFSVEKIARKNWSSNACGEGRSLQGAERSRTKLGRVSRSGGDGKVLNHPAGGVSRSATQFWKIKASNVTIPVGRDEWWVHNDYICFRIKDIDDSPHDFDWKRIGGKHFVGWFRRECNFGSFLIELQEITNQHSWSFWFELRANNHRHDSRK